MTSSNRHWPSMFKSKHTHLWQNDIASSVLSSSTQSSHRTPSTSVEGAGDERAPEPKPRWNPKPEQIRILESIFNSGMVNPPRDEIRKIRAQLQEYGPVGDANVFYWFQNRKSRSKHKLRNGAAATSKKHTAAATAAAATAGAPLPSSTSSPPNKTSPTATFSNVSPPSAVADSTVGPMMTCYSNQTAEGHFPPAPYLPPTPQMHEFWFPDPPMQSYANYSPGFVSDVQLTCHALVPPKCDGEDEVVKVKQLLNYSAPPGSHSLSFGSSVSQGAAVSGAVGPSQGKNMAFINDVAFEVPFGPINVRDVFGYDAVLVNSSAQAVVTDEWGFSLQPLQNGASYYLVRPLAQAPLCGRLQDNAADAVVHDLPF